MSFKPDPKPKRRIVDVAAVAIARHRKTRCRICGKRGESIHHLVPRSLGGDDVLENLVSLCGHGTKGCHGLVEAHDENACVALGVALTDAEREYVESKKGEAFLDRYYGAIT